jgi:hypothetical protein
MPLRDHFHGQLGRERRWEGLHTLWVAMMVQRLAPRLGPRYFAEPTAHVGVSVESDVATFERDASPSTDETRGNGVATAVWAPTKPTVSVATDIPEQDVFEIEVRDEERGLRLVAAVELVSPRNKDRAESRQAFVRKCASYLQERVSVVVVDIVTSRLYNLHTELMQALGVSEPEPSGDDGSMYAMAYRMDKVGGEWRLEMWKERLVVGGVLPTLPLWLASNLAVPLELEQSYEDACRGLLIP